MVATAAAHLFNEIFKNDFPSLTNNKTTPFLKGISKKRVEFLYLKADFFFLLTIFILYNLTNPFCNKITMLPKQNQIKLKITRNIFTKPKQ